MSLGDDSEFAGGKSNWGRKGCNYCRSGGAQTIRVPQESPIVCIEDELTGTGRRRGYAVRV